MTSNCLACNGILGETLFSIPNLPLVDSFCESVEKAWKVPRYNANLCQCNTCTTIQIASPPDTSDIYKNYIYDSSSSPDLMGHFSEYSSFIEKIVLNKNDSILEIGANDGMLLRELVKKGFSDLVAVDPSPQTANIRLPGVQVINNFFSEENMRPVSNKKFTVIIANNCFSHIPQLEKVMKLCKEMLEKTGTLIVEVQSVLDLLENVVFDYVYHEHIFYHSAISFERIARMSGLDLISIQHVPTKGGSYRLLLGHPGRQKIDGSVSYWKYREKNSQVHSKSTWENMINYLQNIKVYLQSDLMGKPKKVFGYGACATGTAFLTYMELEKAICFIVDDNPKRQGRYAPGTGIPVTASTSLTQISRAGRCLVLAWRHSDLIIPKLERLGISYIVPLPSLIVND